MSSVNALISFSHFWAISEQVLQHGRVPSPLPSESAIIGGGVLGMEQCWTAEYCIVPR